MNKYKVTVNAHGTKYCKLNGDLHREDGPSIIYVSGNTYWYLRGCWLSEAQYISGTPGE